MMKYEALDFAGASKVLIKVMNEFTTTMIAFYQQYALFGEDLGLCAYQDSFANTSSCFYALS